VEENSEKVQDQQAQRFKNMQALLADMVNDLFTN
jgi:hypothetical protein